MAPVAAAMGQMHQPAKAYIYAVFVGKGFSLLSAENICRIAQNSEFVGRDGLTDSFSSSAAIMRRTERHSIILRCFPSALTVLVPLVLGGCAAQRARHDSSSEKSANFISEGWILGTTRAEVRARLGPPLAIRIQPMKNQHDPDRIDTLHVFEYEGLTLAFWVGNEEPEREFLTDISVTSTRYELGSELRIGARESEVIRRLGANFTRVRESELRSWMPRAEDRADDTYRYTDDAVHERHAYFSFRAGHVSRVDWVFGVD